jgi:predicted Zn-dependent protease
MRQSKFSSAVDTFREVIAAEPDNALAQFSLGAALLEMDRLDEAETALRRAYQLGGARMPGVQLQLGQVYFRKKDYPKAIEAFEAYLRDLPTAPNAAQVKEAITKLRQASNKP